MRNKNTDFQTKEKKPGSFSLFAFFLEKNSLNLYSSKYLYRSQIQKLSMAKHLDISCFSFSFFGSQS